MLRLAGLPGRNWLPRLLEELEAWEASELRGLNRRVETRRDKFTLPDLDIATCSLPSSLVPMGRVSSLFASQFHGGLQPGVFRLQCQCLLVRYLRQPVVRLVILRGYILGRLVGEFAQDDPGGHVVGLDLSDSWSSWIASKRSIW